MWIEFFCDNCNRSLDHFQASHDSVEFLMEKSNLDCYECNSSLIKVKVRRG